MLLASSFSQLAHISRRRTYSSVDTFLQPLAAYFAAALAKFRAFSGKDGGIGGYPQTPLPIGSKK